MGFCPNQNCPSVLKLSNRKPGGEAREAAKYLALLGILFIYLFTRGLSFAPPASLAGSFCAGGKPSPRSPASDLHPLSLVMRVLHIFQVLAGCICTASAVRTSAAPARASSYALCALRDLALVCEQLRELQAELQPAAEQGYMLQPAHELASLATAIDAGRGALSDSLGALSVFVRKSALIDASLPSSTALTSERQGLQELSSPASTSLKALTSQATKLHQMVAEERQMLLVLEEQESGSVTRTQEMFELLDINGQESRHALKNPTLSGATPAPLPRSHGLLLSSSRARLLLRLQAMARSISTSSRQVLPRCSMSV